MIIIECRIRILKLHKHTSINLKSSRTVQKADIRKAWNVGEFMVYNTDRQPRAFSLLMIWIMDVRPSSNTKLVDKAVASKIPLAICTEYMREKMCNYID